MTNSIEYNAAIEAHNEAIHVFQAVVDAYRAMEVDDAVYLAAAAVKKEADAAFDVAFEAEQNREEIVPVEDDTQLVLL